MNIPSDLNEIQPRATHVWKYDEVDFYTNGKCNRLIYNYKLFTGEIIGKVQTGDQAPFRLTFLVFTQSGGKCFTLPIIVNQAKYYSQYLHFKIPLEWIVHHTPSGYMDRDG